MREIEFDVRYRNLYGTRAGYLPSDRSAITEANRALKADTEAAPADTLHPSVQAFQVLLNEDGVVRMLVTQMIEEVPENHRTVETVPELLRQLNHIVTLAPKWHDKKSRRHFVFWISLCLQGGTYTSACVLPMTQDSP